MSEYDMTKDMADILDEFDMFVERMHLRGAFHPRDDAADAAVARYLKNMKGRYDTRCELKEVLDACPACGSSGVLFHQKPYGYFVKCAEESREECLRTGYYPTIDLAVKAWNSHREV